MWNYRYASYRYAEDDGFEDWVDGLGATFKSESGNKVKFKSLSEEQQKKIRPKLKAEYEKKQKEDPAKEKADKNKKEWISKSFGVDVDPNSNAVKVVNKKLEKELQDLDDGDIVTELLKKSGDDLDPIERLAEFFSEADNFLKGKDSETEELIEYNLTWDEDDEDQPPKDFQDKLRKTIKTKAKELKDAKATDIARILGVSSGEADKFKAIVHDAAYELNSHLEKYKSVERAKDQLTKVTKASFTEAVAEEDREKKDQKRRKEKLKEIGERERVEKKEKKDKAKAEKSEQIKMLKENETKAKDLISKIEKAKSKDEVKDLAGEFGRLKGQVSNSDFLQGKLEPHFKDIEKSLSEATERNSLGGKAKGLLDKAKGGIKGLFGKKASDLNSFDREVMASKIAGFYIGRDED